MEGQIQDAGERDKEPLTDYSHRCWFMFMLRDTQNFHNCCFHEAPKQECLCTLESSASSQINTEHSLTVCGFNARTLTNFTHHAKNDSFNADVFCVLALDAWVEE